MCKLICSAFLISISFLFSSASFAMEEEGWENSSHTSFNPHDLKDIRLEKEDELEAFFEEYRQSGKPIGLAVACGSTEMPYKIRDMFESKVPAIENWVALDLYLADNDSYRSGPHIRMDATDKNHWQQVAGYLKDKGIEVSTVAFTAVAPHINSDLLREKIMPVVKTGGLLIFPSYFKTNYGKNPSADHAEFGDLIVQHGRELRSRYDPHFVSDLKAYHDPEGKFYHNSQALMNSAMGWMKEFAKMGEEEAAQKFAAKVYVNRVLSFNPDYLKDIQAYKFREYNPLSPYPTSQLFLKEDQEFTRDYISYFKDYMREIGFDPSCYRIYSKENAEFYGVETYVYPQDGTFDLAPYNRPSLVIIKQ